MIDIDRCQAKLREFPNQAQKDTPDVLIAQIAI
jgi:hypothetical protein